MAETSSDAEARFRALVDALASNPDVTPPLPGKRFGMSGIKVNGKIFAMLSSDGLVLKLPQARVAALLEAGTGTRFDPRRDGRQMKEWVVVSADADWLALACDALAFVGGAVECA